MASSQHEAGRTAASPLISKLEVIASLSEEDRHALWELCRDVREVPARRDILRDGERADHIHIILGGWAARYKLLREGKRQITAFLIPGDFCDLHATILREMDHGVLALTPATVAYIPHQAMQDLPLNRPALARALWWATLVDEAVLRAWIVNIGRRDAYQGVAHLLCELHVRMRNVGLVEDRSFSLPLTQEELADALGLTPVHVNRVLQRLRKQGLIRLEARLLTVDDPAALREAAGFDPSYLHERKRNNLGH